MVACWLIFIPAAPSVELTRIPTINRIAIFFILFKTPYFIILYYSLVVIKYLGHRLEQ